MSYDLIYPDAIPAGADDDSGGWTLLPPAKDIPRELARQGGLAARYAVEGAAALPNMVGGLVNRVWNDPGAVLGLPAGMAAAPAWARLGDPGQATSALLTSAGLPEPRSAAERVVGDVSRATAGGGSLIGGAQRAGNAALAAQPIRQAISAALAGGAGGATREAGGGEGLQLAASLLAGMSPTATSIVPAAVGAAKRTVGAVAAPFYQGGRERIVGNTMARFANDPQAALGNMGNPPNIVPGSMPTSAQASQDLGLIGLERGLANNPASPFMEQAAANNRARLKLLNANSSTDRELEMMEAQRSGDAAANYGAANAQLVKLDPRGLVELSSRPSFKKAMKTAAQLAAEDGMPMQEQQLDNPRYLHFIKLALDDQVETGALQGVGSAQRRAIVGTKNDFLDLLDQASPDYQRARSTFAAQTKDIEAGTTMRDIMQKGQLAGEDAQGNPVLSQAKLKQLIADPERMAKLTPGQREAVLQVMEDLNVSTRSVAGKAVGSNTVQNLATQNLLGRSFGGNFANNAFGQSVLKPARWFLEGGAESRVQQLLNDAMADPTLGARLLALSQGTKPNYFADLLRRAGAPARGTVFGTASNDHRSE